MRVGPSGYLGIVVGNSSPRGNQGQTITQIVKNGPADRIGMVAGSTLISVGGTTVTPRTNLADLIRVLEPGDKISVTWITPSGTRKTATATVGASPLN